MPGENRAAIAPALIGTVVAFAATSKSSAFINVELRPTLQSVSVGSTVSIGLYVVSDSSVSQGLSAAQVIFSWQTAYLHLLSNSNSGAASLLQSNFPTPDPYGINELSIPQDGDAMYVGLATFGSPVMATPAGTLLTTLRFTALAPVASSPVSLLISDGNPVGYSTVFDGAQPNTPVTGTLAGAGVQIVPCPGVAVPLALAGLVRKRVAAR